MKTAGGMIKKIPFEAGPAEQKLASGIKSYEDGDYKGSQAALQAALDMGLSGRADQVVARKYLAFMDCVSGREKQCREEFRRALEIDPSFDLKPAEAGHPLWGPVFRNVKEKPAK
jgi:hypothetical protein